jgi:hypothetical protein
MGYWIEAVTYLSKLGNKVGVVFWGSRRIVRRAVSRFYGKQVATDVNLAVLVSTCIFCI